MLNTEYNFLKGFSNVPQTNILPLQTKPTSKKGERWKKATMDRLEQIGLEQLYENMPFRDYYRMTEGRLVVADYQDPPEVTRDIMSIRSEVGLPSYIQHYDIIGQIVNQLVGEFDGQKDNIKITSTDMFAQNDYVREKTQLINQYTKQLFEIELQKLLLMEGIDVENAPEFKTEEERQNYIQQVEQRKNQLIPPEHIEKQLSKNFKVKAVEWAEHVWEADRIKYRLNDLEKRELKHFLLTGRFFRHYHIGYDFYKPEEWKPLETFFSQDLDIKYPQDGEYVGRIHFISVSDFIQKFGSKLKKSQIESVAKSFVTETSEEEQESYSLNKLGSPLRAVQAPNGYFENELLVEFQEAFQTPLGESYKEDEEGNETVRPSWLESYHQSSSYFGHEVAQHFREDIVPRKDLLRLTEAYWRSFQQVAYLYYETPLGTTALESVTDELLPEFLKENGIKKVNRLTIEDFEKGVEDGSLEVNSICYTYIPQIWRGKKVAGVGTRLIEDLYFDIEPLEFQIKGDSNLYDLKLPVSGIVTNSLARKLRPFQFLYNILKNSAVDGIKREMGEFLLMDIDFLPSHIKGLGDTGEILANLKQMVRETGILPQDLSQQNTQGKQPNANTLVKQSITYHEQFAIKNQQARLVKQEALEYIGITPERIGSPSEYSTAEGIKQGVNASFAQTEPIYHEINEAHLKACELHLNIAQFCETRKTESSVFYQKSDGDYIFKQFFDDTFPLRHIGVMPSNSAKERREAELFKQIMLQDNTLDTDPLFKAELLTSDSFVSIVQMARNERLRKQQEAQQNQQFQREQLQTQIEAEDRQKQEEKEFELEKQAREHINKKELKAIDAYGRAVDTNAEKSHLDALDKFTTKVLAQNNQQAKLNLEEKKVKNQKEHQDRIAELKEEELAAKLKEIDARLQISRDNKKIAVVNKN